MIEVKVPLFISENDIIVINEGVLKQHYDIVCTLYEKYLKNLKVKKPFAFGTLGAAQISLLAYGYPNTKIWNKSQVNEALIRLGYKSNDPQYIRHAATQDGYNILQYKLLNKKFSLNLKSGFYYLQSLNDKHPMYDFTRRKNKPQKASKDSICRSCCGMKGEDNRRYMGIITFVSYQHANPDEPLSRKNKVLLCDICNRTQKNLLVWDDENEFPRPSKHAWQKSIDFYNCV